MQVTVHSGEEMQELGEKLAKQLEGGALIELIGDVGSGKTTFTKGLAKGLGVKEIVQSPSFTIFARYEAKNRRELHHYDFYRLVDPGLVVYDLDESLKNPHAITVIEWADHVKDILPDRHITIKIISTDESERNVIFKGLKNDISN